jgi:hypothetical protein
VNDPEWNLLSGATVTILDKATNLAEIKVTGTETFYYSVGRVIFESRPITANYKVTVSMPGYRTYEQDFAFDNNNEDKRDLLVELDKKSILTGVVTDGANPIPGVQVKIQDTDLVTFTDNAGKYSLLMGGGAMQVRFVKAGYERVIIPVNVAPLITATLNQTLAATTFGMAEGLITTDEGVGIPGVEIKNGSVYLGATDSFGYFSLRLSGGNYDLRFTKSGYNGVQINPYAVTAGMDDFLQFYLFPPSTANHVENGTGFYSWHQSVGTPAHAFFIPEYSVDVWWGMGRIKMGVDVNTSSSSTKVTNLTINLAGLTWEAHKVEGSGDIEGSGINIPITIAAGGASNLRTRIDVYRVAIESAGQEIWFDDSYWSSAQGASNSNSLEKTFPIPVASQTVAWDDSFRVKMWMRVQKMEPNTTDGEGSGALSGYHLDRKLVSWYPKKPVTTTVTSTWSAIWGYVLDAVENPLNAILSLTDLFSVQERVNYTMEEVLPQDFPGYPPDD